MKQLDISSKKYLDTLETEFLIDNGSETITVRLGALEFNHALSPSGDFLLVQLANSKTEDSGKFVKIDTKTGDVVYSVMPEWGWASKYEFLNQSAFRVVTNDYGTHEVNENGMLLDRAGFYRIRIKSSDFCTANVIDKFFELHGKNTETFGLVLSSLDEVIEKCFSNFHGKTFCVRALKAKADVLIEMELLKEALQCCIDALNLDPKAPLKKLHKSLCKKLDIDDANLTPSGWVLELKKSAEEVRAKELMARDERRYSRLLLEEKSDGDQPKQKPLGIKLNRKPIVQAGIITDRAVKANGYSPKNALEENHCKSERRSKIPLCLGIVGVMVFLLWLFQH
ncbi:hypothetical protein [Pantoea agglomerans]|uniref:hypothetical protein n=1 Tax=Enterobacter agglomerans TaxID=549 RepID=UPI001786C5C3|nr:hypothetical protein [Pantoea agglomerans]MBD8152259.1 hypothetical protein [Pantoea agglomerans]MBD8231437.1 hypothetical protein [Pantoea agglomerans]